MADIASRAKVSVTTVSHVVNKSRPVSPETERAVLNAIAETGYVPDSVTRSLRTAGSRIIGLAMSSITNPYFGDVVHGFERAATAAGYSLLLADTHDEDSGELRAMSDLLSRRVDAVVLAPSADPTRALRHAEQQRVPVLLIDRMLELDLDQIGTESVEPTAQLVDHLVEVGHRRIAMVTGQPELGTTIDRLHGYRVGLRRNGVRWNREYVRSGYSSDEGAERALAELMGLPRVPTAVVVGNNRMTIGVMRAARTLGVRIPDDLALVAFDDFEWADLFHPRLTAIAQPTQSLGEQAFALVASRLADPSAPSRRVVLRPTFVHRESCGCRAT
jgi:LacI family transcriptional regulator